MLRKDLSHEESLRQHEFINGEFERCAHILNLFEQHGITYLSTVNGGGAAAVIGFAGSAQYAEGWPVFALISFLIGTVLIGIAIAIGHTRLSKVCDGLSADHSTFNHDLLDLPALWSNHAARFSSWRHGVSFAYGSGFCFLAGLVFSVLAFQAYPDWKTAKEAKADTSKKTSEIPLNVTCISPEVKPFVKKAAP